MRPKRKNFTLRRGRGVWWAAAAGIMVGWVVVNGCEKSLYVEAYGVEAGGRVKGLQAAITSDKEIYKVGESIKIACELENVTKEEVGIMQIVGAGMKQLGFEIRDRQGKVINYSIRQSAAPSAGGARMTTIKPYSSWFLREIIRKDEYIFEGVDFWNTPGEYTLAAIISGTSDKAIMMSSFKIEVGEEVEEFSGRRWEGIVKSNIITIKIEDEGMSE